MTTSELKHKEILPKDVREHMHLLWENDEIILPDLFKILEKVSIDMFFMDLIMVPPSKFRRVGISHFCFQKKFLILFYLLHKV